MVHVATDTPCDEEQVSSQTWLSGWPRRDGRDFHRRKAQEHAQVEEAQGSGDQRQGSIRHRKDYRSGHGGARWPRAGRSGAGAHSSRSKGSNFTHEIVNHAVEYVRGHVHTQGIENFWALLKRGLNGTYISVEPFHLDRYVDEQA